MAAGANDRKRYADGGLASMRQTISDNTVFNKLASIWLETPLRQKTDKVALTPQYVIKKA